MSTTVYQVSDTHISTTHSYFVDNWLAFVEVVKSSNPDLVINSGDFSFNGPVVEEDIAYAQKEANTLGIQCLAIPGNHDVGEPGENPRLKQPINAERIERWKHYFGDDKFLHDIENWRLIGINSELLGSGLTQENDQWGFLEAGISSANGRSLGLFSHKPLFEKSPDEGATKWSILPTPRKRLLDLLLHHNFSFIASGHLHRYRNFRYRGVDMVWCPTTAFVTPVNKKDGCIRRVGYLKWTFEGSATNHVYIEPENFINHDMTWKTKESGTTITLPPKPLPIG